MLCPKAWALQVRWDLCTWAGLLEKLEHPGSNAAGGETTKIILKMMRLGKKLMEEGASQIQGILEVMQVEEELMEMFLVGLGGFVFEKGGMCPSRAPGAHSTLSFILHNVRILSYAVFLNGNFAPSPTPNFSIQDTTLM